MIDIDMRNSDAIDLLRSMKDKVAQTLVTSPPYGIGKEYERKITTSSWLEWIEPIVREAKRVTAEHMFWQVGNHVKNGVVTPLDIILYPILACDGWVLRNRIAWTYGHGLHASRRFSGRHETVLWFTRGDNYHFDLDAVRVPQKWPQKKYYKGPKKGELSGNPLGKNPGDVWDIPNVKHNHPEKTEHPCQFPEHLAQRIISCSTRFGDVVLDPFMGSGTTAIVAAREGRRFIGGDISKKYIAISNRRLAELKGEK